MPSLKRCLPSIALNYEGEVILFDCGEGTQRQMMQGKIGFSKNMKIFITHLHGDHVLGIPGLLQTMSLLDRRTRLEVFGPKGIFNFIDSARTYLRFGLRFPVEISEVGEGVICNSKKYRIIARWAEHAVPNLAYAFVEKDKPGKFYPKKAVKLDVPKGPLWHRLQHGRRVRLKDGRVVESRDVVGSPKPGIKIVYSGDTSPCKSVLKMARNADLLIHECTLDDSLVSNAEVEQHSTPTQVGNLAKKADVEKLILTHISTRYRDASILVNQAKKVFGNTQVAKDLLSIELSA